MNYDWTLTFADTEVELFMSRFETTMKERKMAYKRNGFQFSFAVEKHFKMALAVAKVFQRPLNLMQTSKADIDWAVDTVNLLSRVRG